MPTNIGGHGGPPYIFVINDVVSYKGAELMRLGEKSKDREQPNFVALRGRVCYMDSYRRK